MKVKNLEREIKEKVILLFNPIKVNTDLRKQTDETSRIKAIQFAINNNIKNSSLKLISNEDDDYD